MDRAGPSGANALGERQPTSYHARVAVHVEYVTTSDGVRIAYATRGRGPAIVSMPPIPCRHVELEWEVPEEAHMSFPDVSSVHRSTVSTWTS